MAVVGETSDMGLHICTPVIISNAITISAGMQTAKRSSLFHCNRLFSASESFRAVVSRVETCLSGKTFLKKIFLLVSC